MTSSWELAELLTATLSTLGGSGDTAIAFTADGPTLTPSMDRKVAGATLQIQPWGEAEEASDRGDMLAGERTINVVLQAPLDSLAESTCLQWLNEVKEGFRELSLVADDGDWRWRRNETVTLYDSDAAKQRRQYISIFRATFYNYT